MRAYICTLIDLLSLGEIERAHDCGIVPGLQLMSGEHHSEEITSAVSYLQVGPAKCFCFRRQDPVGSEMTDV